LSDEELERRVAPPAIAMLVVAALSTLVLGVSLVADPLRALCEACNVTLPERHGLVVVIDVLWRLFMLAVAAVVLIGSLQLLRRRSWIMGLVAAVLSIVPCIGPCCPLGIPVGAWALYVLLRPDVRQAMERGA
jgi:hypothetical protein